MPIQKLSHAGALGAGSDLWILPGSEVSQWNRKIDWYLNFQLSRAKGHETPQVSESVKEILKDNEIDHLKLEVTPKTNALMVASQERLPNRQTVKVPYVEYRSPKEWISSIENIWTNLEQPPLRVFLPKDITPEDFQKLWSSDTKEHKITLVSEIK